MIPQGAFKHKMKKYLHFLSFSDYSIKKERVDVAFKN